MKITVEADVRAPIKTVWKAWHDPDQITKWNTASEDWHSPHASVDLRVGGNMVARMEAKDGSMGFDFEQQYTRIEAPRLVESVMADGRKIRVEFIDHGDHVHVKETFDAEAENDVEMQRAGWQAILDSFARHVEGT